MRPSSSKFLFKFAPVDPEIQNDHLNKLLYPSMSLFDFLNETRPFTFAGDSYEFNEIFFNGEFKQNNILEIIYSSSFQKTCLINYILVSFFTSQFFLNLEDNEDLPIPEIIYIDAANNFNILALHGLISEHLFYRSIDNPKFKDQNYVDELISRILSHINIYRVYDFSQFLCTLKMISFTIEKNKNIKLIFIDSINNFPHYEQIYNKARTQYLGSKEKSAAPNSETIFTHNATEKKTMKQIMKLVEEIKSIRQIGFIVTKKELFKTFDLISFNFQEKCLHASNRISKVFRVPLFKEPETMTFLMNFTSLETNAWNYIYNDRDILKKLDSFNLQGYSVADIVQNGNLCFALKNSEPSQELFCYFINKSNFFFLKSYPCLLME